MLAACLTSSGAVLCMLLITLAMSGHNVFAHFLQEFNIEKLQLLEAEKAKVRKDYERREGQIDVKKKM